MLVAGPATTGDSLTFDNMKGEPVRLPATATLKPGEELKIVIVLEMHAGMQGPHVFRLKLPVAGPDGGAQQTLELYVRGLFK